MTNPSEFETNAAFMPERLDTRAKLLELLAQRRSPRAFSESAIEPSKLVNLFEAARWSPSSSNEQPWRFIAATKEDTRVYAIIAESLMEANRRWAVRAPLLVVGMAQTTYLKSGKPYLHALYDLGQSVAHMTVQASALGLSVHQMGGFDANKLRSGFSIPEGYDIVIVLAIGYAEHPNTLPDDLRSREEAPRKRKPLEAIVFTDSWEKPSYLVEAQDVSLKIQSSSN
ncbi:MAG: nitroreductase family protein [Ignavibacteriales bacterium]|nr:nitroreductase family protein [Ignavibacteriales bacterium]